MRFRKVGERTAERQPSSVGDLMNEAQNPFEWHRSHGLTQYISSHPMGLGPHSLRTTEELSAHIVGAKIVWSTWDAFKLEPHCQEPRYLPAKEKLCRSPSRRASCSIADLSPQRISHEEKYAYFRSCRSDS